MWISISVITLFFCSLTKATDTSKNYCEMALSECLPDGPAWVSCYERIIRTCRPKSRAPNPNFYFRLIEPLQEVDVAMGNHTVKIPLSALKMSQGDNEKVQVVVTTLNSSYFEPTPTRPVLDKSVLVVKAGIKLVRNLSDPVKLLFKSQEQWLNGICVYWDYSDVEGSGNWSTDGCSTYFNGTYYTCSCNHLSFFAILVNPAITVNNQNALNLTYLSYFGSAVSVIFTLISFFIYFCLHWQRPEKALGIHIQLAVAMLCLHLSFLVSSLFLWYNPQMGNGGLCKALGLILHWSLLATLSWAALEGFHLYLLLIRVFNIYVRKYVLKISLFGWGLPTLVAVICIIADIYGKYTTDITDANNQTSIGQMCWISNSSPHSLIVSYVTTVAYPCLVILFNASMLSRVVCQLWGLRRTEDVMKGRQNWKIVQKKMKRLWKDAVTVLGLTCVLGLPWGLASISYISTAGIYVFTVFNALQGFFLFLWCLALRAKSKSETYSSIRDQSSSSHKMIDTSL